MFFILFRNHLAKEFDGWLSAYFVHPCLASYEFNCVLVPLAHGDLCCLLSHLLMFLGSP